MGQRRGEHVPPFLESSVVHRLTRSDNKIVALRQGFGAALSCSGSGSVTKASVGRPPRARSRARGGESPEVQEVQYDSILQEEEEGGASIPLASPPCSARRHVCSRDHGGNTKRDELMED